MRTLSRNSGRIVKAAGLVLVTLTSIVLAAPAEARLPEFGAGGPLSGGVFHGVPIRPQSAAARQNEVERGLVSSDCRIVRQSARDRLGSLIVREVQVCE